ncbi:MAG: PAS domain S-box protein, partial [Armatimonadota bacterium]
AQAVPLKGTNGSVECWLGTLTDVDSQRRQADAHRYLIRAGMMIAESPDYESTLSAVAHLAIPEFADWCIIHLLESDGEIRVVEIAHANPVNSQWAVELLRKYQVDPIALVGISNVIRTGKSVMYTRITDDLLMQSAKDDEHHSLLRQAGLESAMIVPLNCGGTGLGAITYITAGSGKHYDETDLAHAEDLAYRAALAVTNAQLQQTTQRHLVERTTTEAALRESESRFRAMADSAPVMLWMTNAAGKCNYFSKAWLAFTGRQLAEEVGDGWVQGLDPDDLDRCSRTYRQAFDQRIPYEIEYRLRRVDGEIRWIWDNATPVWTAEGEFVGYIGSCIDISERKMAADENARLLQELRGSSERERAILRDVLASLTQHRLSLCDNPHGLPSKLPIIVASLDIDASSLRDLRGMIEDTAIAVGLPEDRWADLVNAAGEAALNAVMHAGGGQAHIFTDGQAIVQVWVQDNGTGISAIPDALEAGFTTAGSFGHGFWMMLEMADRMWLLTGDTGTTVVIEQHAKRPEPTWMHSDFSTATV